MKVKIKIELDLSDTSYNIDKISLVPVCLQNLSSWLDDLHKYHLLKRLDAFDYVDKKELFDSMIKISKEDEKLSKQLFNNYTVSGETEDGHKFLFTHKEPGYLEKTILDGIETHIEPSEI